MGARYEGNFFVYYRLSRQIIFNINGESHHIRIIILLLHSNSISLLYGNSNCLKSLVYKGI